MTISAAAKKGSGLRVFFSIFFVYSITSAITVAQAVQRKPQSVEQFQAATDQLSTLADLNEVFKKKKKPFFKALKTAYEDILKKKPSAALSKLKAVSIPQEYGDYKSYLLGEAEHTLLQDLMAEKRPSAKFAAERAIKHFQNVIEKFPYSPLTKRTVMALADTEVSLANIEAINKRSKVARELFENGFKRYSHSGLLVLVPQDHIITYAVICEKAPDEICRNWLDKLADYLDKTEDVKFLKKIAALQPTVKAPKKPKTNYSVAMDLQEFQKGFFIYMAGDFNEAYAIWFDLLKTYPFTNIKVRTKFWMARAAHKTNHMAQATTLYKEAIHDAPFSYYALLSYWFSYIDPARMISGEVPMIARSPSKTSAEEISKLRRAEEFIANDAYDLAAFELRDIQYTDTMPNEFLVYLAYLNHLARNHRHVISIYGELSNRGSALLFSSLGGKLLFPRTYFEKVEKAALKYKLDPVIPLSIIKQESAFDAEAASYANAYGLMQIIKPTAKDLDKTITIPDLITPDRNVQLGTKYIAQLLKRYNGSLIHALAAYNAGPHNSDRWQREISKDLPLEEYIELITYKETREYVQNILRNRYWYNRIYEQKEITNLKDLANTTVEYTGD